MNLIRRVARRALDGRTLSRRILDRELRRVLRRIDVDIVLDVGGASGLRYRTLVGHRRYWTADLQIGNRPSVQADAHRLPVRTAAVDLVLSIQVLEHCREPRLILSEAHRVLKPGGLLVLSTVLMYERHGSPEDYYRFTESALDDLARPFGTRTILPLGNRFVAVYDLSIAKSVVLNSLAGRLAFRLGTTASPVCPTGFVLVARKAGE